MQPEIRHIVFDIGKVLIHYDPEIPFKRLIPNDDERAWFFENLCSHDWNMEQDRGRDWPEAEADLVAKFPDHEENIRAFRKYWHEMVSHHYADSVAIFEKLIDDGHDVTMLTNFADNTFTQAEDLFPFLKKPRGVTVSARVKLIKPDPEIYKVQMAAFDLSPEHCFFVDDSQPNIDAARALGWHAFLFTDADQLKRDLESCGITV